MEEIKKKIIFRVIVVIAIIILIGVGSTFAYFTATITAENVVSLGAAEFEIDFIRQAMLVNEKAMQKACAEKDTNWIDNLSQFIA